MKKIVAMMVALTVLCSICIPSVSVFADGDETAKTYSITAEEVTVKKGTEEAKDVTEQLVSYGEEEYKRGESDGMLQLSQDTLINIVLKLQGDVPVPENEEVLFFASKAGETEYNDSNTQYLDQKRVGEDGTITIKFRPRKNNINAIGIYNMRAGAKDAEIFSKYYKTINDKIQAVVPNAKQVVDAGNDIEITISDYSDDWAENNILKKVVEGGEDVVLTKGTDYTLTPDGSIATLNIKTDKTWKGGTHTFKFVPNADAISYNTAAFTAEVEAYDPTYTLTFVTDGSAVDAKTFKGSEVANGVSLANIVSEKTGYTFGGWFKAETGGEAITAVTSENLAEIFDDKESATLYAQWSTAEYDITYNLDGGTNNSANPAKYTVENANITLEAPTKNGYTFGGWYSEAGFTTKVETIVTSEAKNIELFAKWDINTYTITYNLNNGTNNAENLSSYKVTDSNITLKDPTRKGYTFGGWYSEAGFTTKVETIVTSEAKNIELFAKWTAITYTIKFDVNGGAETIANSTGSLDGTLPTLPTVNPTKEGWNFSGWFTAADGEQVVEASNLATIDELLHLFGNKTEIMLYAHYSEIGKFTVAYSATGAENVPASQLHSIEEQAITVASAEPTKKGYKFKGWKLSGDESGKLYKAGDTYTADFTNVTILTFTAEWEAEKYTITYMNVEAGEHSNRSEYTIETETITLSAPTARSGYTFGGWYSEATFAAEVKTIDKGSIGNITLYAKWEEESYTVGLELQGGTGVNEKTISGTLAAPPALPSGNPTKNGYIFKGWFDAATGGNLITEITAENLTALDGKIIYAQWTPETYTITYNGLEGAAHSNPTSYNIESETITLTDPAEIDGYTFGGWYSDDAFTNEIKAITKGSTGNITLYARWTDSDPTQYRINDVTTAGSTTKVNITNKPEGNVWLIVAQYGADRKFLKAKISSSEGFVKERGIQNVEIEEALNGDYDSAYVYMWNNLEEMTPLCDAYPVGK